MILIVVTKKRSCNTTHHTHTHTASVCIVSVYGRVYVLKRKHKGKQCIPFQRLHFHSGFQKTCLKRIVQPKIKMNVITFILVQIRITLLILWNSKGEILKNLLVVLKVKIPENVSFILTGSFTLVCSSHKAIGGFRRRMIC